MAKRQAARDLTAAAAVGALTVDVADRYPLEDIAKAHEQVDAGGRGRVVVTVPGWISAAGGRVFRRGALVPRY